MELTMAKKETLPIAELELDTVNPRINPKKNQTDAMRSLLAIESDGEKVFALAEDICEIGMLDPAERLCVIASQHEPKRYTVLDGNRRLTALRLLSQPGLVDRDDIGLSSAMRNRFKRLQVDFHNRWPKEVDVVVFNDRAAANRFIRLRHTGENGGAGRSAWSALQVARFDHTGLWECIVQLRAENALDLEVLNELDRSTFSITNFERVAITSQFQKRFSYVLGKNTFAFGEDKARALKALSRLASDVVSGRVDSRGIFAEAKSMSPYFDEVEAAITPSAKSAPDSFFEQPVPVEESQNNEDCQAEGDTRPTENIPPNWDSASKPETTDNAGSRLVRKKRTLKYLVDKKSLQTVTNQKCREIVDELKGHVEVENAPYACALLLRSLLEMTAEIYLKALNEKTSDKTANIAKAAKLLLANKHATDPQDHMALAISFQRSAQAYDQLCDTAHSTVSMYSSAHARATWQNLGGGLDLLWRRIHASEVATK